MSSSKFKILAHIKIWPFTSPSPDPPATCHQVLTMLSNSYILLLHAFNKVSYICFWIVHDEKKKVGFSTSRKKNKRLYLIHMTLRKQLIYYNLRWMLIKIVVWGREEYSLTCPSPPQLRPCGMAPAVSALLQTCVVLADCIYSGPVHKTKKQLVMFLKTN